MASERQIDNLLESLRDLKTGRMHDAMHDLVFEMKAREAAMIMRDSRDIAGYLIEAMGPRLAEKTLRGIASR